VCAESVQGTKEHSEHSVGFLQRYADFVSRVAEFRMSNIQNSPGSIETAYMLIMCRKCFGCCWYIEDLELCCHLIAMVTCREVKRSFPVHLFLKDGRSSDFSRKGSNKRAKISES
jgi:hypothetical protein